jgi:spore germination protein YaaH
VVQEVALAGVPPAPRRAAASVPLITVRCTRLVTGFSTLALAVGVAAQPAPVHSQHIQDPEVQRRLVLGYYVPYDSTSWVSLQAHSDQIDLVGAQWVGIDACGNLSSRDDQTLKQFAQERGLAVVPSLLTLSPTLNHQLLDDDDTAARAIEQIVGYIVAEGYAGFDLDLEGVDPADRDALVNFTSALGAALHAQEKLLTLAVPAKDRDATVGWSGAYDYAALGALADLVTIMAYEYRGPFSGPGSVAPFEWVRRVAAFASSQIAPDKVLLGLAFYGYDWNVTSGGARSLGWSGAMALAEQFEAEPSVDPDQQSLTFEYTALAGDRVPTVPQAARITTHQITSREAPACDVALPPPTPTPSRRPPPPAGTPQLHSVWLEESNSAAARLGLADAYRLGGIATWRLGLEDPAVWPAFEAWRQARDANAS